MLVFETSRSPIVVYSFTERNETLGKHGSPIRLGIGRSSGFPLALLRIYMCTYEIESGLARKTVQSSQRQASYGGS